MNVRREVVRRLLNVALDAVTAAVKDERATSDEVFSTYFTLVRNAVIVAREGGANMIRVRAMLHTILLEGHDAGRPQ